MGASGSLAPQLVQNVAPSFTGALQNGQFMASSSRAEAGVRLTPAALDAPSIATVRGAAGGSSPTGPPHTAAGLFPCK